MSYSNEAASQTQLTDATRATRAPETGVESPTLHTADLMPTAQDDRTQLARKFVAASGLMEKTQSIALRARDLYGEKLRQIEVQVRSPVSGFTTVVEEASALHAKLIEDMKAAHEALVTVCRLGNALVALQNES